MFLTLIRVIVGIFGFLIIHTHAVAQDVKIAQPTSNIGSVWKYRTTDLWNGKEISTNEIELVDIQSNRLITRHRNSINSRISTIYYDQNLSRCSNMRNSDEEICAGPLKFPITIGAKHKFEKLPWPNGEGYNSEECEAVALEEVTVPAGLFEAIRVECSGFGKRVFNGNFNGRITEKYWYSPKVGRYVKVNYVNYAADGKMFDRTQSELIEYTLK